MYRDVWNIVGNVIVKKILFIMFDRLALKKEILGPVLYFNSEDSLKKYKMEMRSFPFRTIGQRAWKTIGTLLLYMLTEVRILYAQ